MKLKKLIIHGFKSFKDKTVIRFDDKITGIVGPNGCGKSNIVDALFWVMGEQSAKHLRGKSMQDVIFAGSTKVGASHWAQATLVLENISAKHIHIGGKVCTPLEIELTRKLYRNSETEYFINKIPCRLKDIHEVFMDTGAGAKSYSIIAQGEINKMVQAKPLERRVMIEEVAGITKFKLRKRESLKKIELTNENLKRIEDLQIEIDKNLNLLKNQAEKAEKAKDLKDKIENLELLISSFEEQILLQNFCKNKTIISEKEALLSDLITDKQMLEGRLENFRSEQKNSEDELEKRQEELLVSSNELATSKERLLNINKQLKTVKTELESRSSELVHYDKDLSLKQREVENKKIELSQIEEKISRQPELETLEFECDEINYKVESLIENVSTLKYQSDSQKQQVLDSKNKIEQLQFKVNDASGQIDDVTKLQNDLESKYGNSNVKIKETEELLQKSEEGQKEIENDFCLNETKLNQVQERNTNLDNAIRDLEKDLIYLESKEKSINEINKALDCDCDGNISFLKNWNVANLERQGLQKNPVSLVDQIHCDSRYSKAIQNILSNLLDAIIVSNKYTCVESWIENSYSTKKNKIILDNDNMAAHDLNDLDKIKVLQLENIKKISSFCGNTLAVSDVLQNSQIPEAILFNNFIIEEANFNFSLLKDIDFKTISTIDGQIFIENIAGNIVVSTIPKDIKNNSMGIIERNNLLSEIKAKIVLDTNKLEKLRTESKEYVFEIQKLKETIKLQTKELSQLKSNVASYRSQLETSNNFLNDGIIRLNIFKERKEKLSNQKLEYLEKIEEIEFAYNQNQDQLEETDEMLSAAQMELEALKNLASSKKDDLNKLKLERNSLGYQRENLANLIAQMNSYIASSDQKRNSLLDLIESKKTIFYNMDIDLVAIKENSERLEKMVEDQKYALSKFQGTYKELQIKIDKDDNQFRKYTKDIVAYEKDILLLVNKNERNVDDEYFLVKDIFEKYRVDLRSVVNDYLKFEDNLINQLSDIKNIFLTEKDDEVIVLKSRKYNFIEKNKFEIDRLKYQLRAAKKDFENLGEINWQALNDYKRQKIRHDFLVEEKEILQTSVDDLQNAIETIDEKCKERFFVAFNEVNERFQKVFPIIFGGGNSHLALTGTLDDVECGIDILASPPGKKMQNINLMSGGEKAMTAVSLIFSIFLVKPSPFCLLDEVDAPLDDANVGRFNQLLREMSSESQFILITHNKKTMELNNRLYGVTMQQPGISTAVSVVLQ